MKSRRQKGSGEVRWRSDGSAATVCSYTLLLQEGVRESPWRIHTTTSKFTLLIAIAPPYPPHSVVSEDTQGAIFERRNL